MDSETKVGLMRDAFCGGMELFDIIGDDEAITEIFIGVVGALQISVRNNPELVQALEDGFQAFMDSGE